MRNDLAAAAASFGNAAKIRPYSLADAMLSFEEQRAIANAHIRKKSNTLICLNKVSKVSKVSMPSPLNEGFCQCIQIALAKYHSITLGDASCNHVN
jgi:hypothetical protein